MTIATGSGLAAGHFGLRYSGPDETGHLPEHLAYERRQTGALPSIGADRTAVLVGRLRSELGIPANHPAVTVDPVRRERASVDWAPMSPILAELLPAGLADVVVTPSHADQIPVVLAAAFDLGVPVTPRGTGLGNYGQGIPLAGGIVLDLARCRAILDVRDGEAEVEAGARLRDVDAAAARGGQELTIYPSTKGSTVGGFLAGGSGGTGSITHGSNADGFVHALDVAPCDGSRRLLTVRGEETLPFVHAYGTTGIIARATIGLEPRRAWVGLYAAFDDGEAGYSTATAAMRLLRGLDPAPRLVSFDEAAIVAVLPADAALDPKRSSLRAIVRAEQAGEASAIVAAAGGTVLAVREGDAGADRLTSLSYNHSTFHLQKKVPGLFHLEVAGDVLRTEPARVRAVFPGTLLHLEELAETIGGMLMAPFRSPAQVYAGMAELERIGVGLHSPHTWLLERRLDTVLATRAQTDPKGLLNPGKIAA